jgi:hypothetical protein
MPAAIYAISFKSTLSVLGVMSLEKQSLDDAAARDRFLKRVVGEQLRISMKTKTAGQLLLDRTELAIDEIDIADPAPLITDPYVHKLTGQSPTSTVAGDGTPKKASKVSNAIDLTLTQTGVLTVKLHNSPTEVITVGLLFEGQELVTSTLPPTFLPATPTVAFNVGALTPNEFYAAVVIAKDVPTTAMRLQAT